MKKFIALVAICLGLLFLQNSYSLSSVSASYEGTYTFYTLENFEDEQVEVIQCGNGFLVSCDNQVATEIYTELDKELLQGESFCFDGDLQDIYQLLYKLNVTETSIEQVEDIYIIYGYSSMLGNSVEVDGEKINIQIALREDIITVGTPLILGSY